jgi:hypothetical protein
MHPYLPAVVPTVALVALLAFTSRADAASLIVQTVTYDSTDYSGSVVTDGFSGNSIADLVLSDSFAPFDPALGTLNAVTVVLSLTFQIDWTDPNPTTSPSISGGVDIVWDVDGPGEEKIWGTGGGNGTGPSSSGSLTMSMQTTATTPGDFDFDLTEFNSPYTLSILSDSMSVGGSNGASVDYELTSGSMSVTYDYAAIPEPGTSAAFAGLAVLGFALRRRRARPACVQEFKND